jgi:hypothetical protein
MIGSETQAAYFNSTGLKSEMTKHAEVSLASERTAEVSSQLHHYGAPTNEPLYAYVTTKPEI